MNVTPKITLSSDQTVALAELEAIANARRGIMARLKAAEKVTADKVEKRRIKRAKTKITQKNLALVNTRNRILREKSLGPIINQIANLRAEAERADQNLKDLVRILGQAAEIVGILGRLANIFG